MSSGTIPGINGLIGDADAYEHRQWELYGGGKYLPRKVFDQAGELQWWCRHLHTVPQAVIRAATGGEHMASLRQAGLEDIPVDFGLEVGKAITYKPSQLAVLEASPYGIAVAPHIELVVGSPGNHERASVIQLTKHIPGRSLYKELLNPEVPESEKRRMSDGLYSSLSRYGRTVVEAALAGTDTTLIYDLAANRQYTVETTVTDDGTITRRPLLHDTEALSVQVRPDNYHALLNRYYHDMVYNMQLACYVSEDVAQQIHDDYYAVAPGSPSTVARTRLPEYDGLKLERLLDSLRDYELREYSGAPALPDARA